ncbi:maturation protein [ssRNA phage Esthiorhiza.2_38]|uniref:Maturation protein n=2 Tax=Fiersviridae TaxID=2842319 RepID=A0A8S5KY93_9VIRU|nr:maturation protein [ssRNA phage Esthiorhiza.2_38]QDH87734.1 MAG: hypothetical protein H2RhizoLitter49740_000003 [Leviviridae sp.]DAD50393.1 TPA_asm: maturation protein [ssRNA phage Esthiorhiza.2_38]
MANIDFLNVPKYASVLRDLKGLGLMGRLGKYYEVHVLANDGSVVYRSGRVRLHELPGLLRLARGLASRGLRVYLCLYAYLTSTNAVACALVPWNKTSFPGIISVPVYASTYRQIANKLQSATALRVKRKRSAWASSSKAAQRSTPESRFKTMESRIYNLNGFISNSFSEMEVYFRSWTGTRTPNFGKLKTRGSLPDNNHSVVIRVTSGGARFANYTSSNPLDRHDDLRYDTVEAHTAVPGGPSHLAKAHDKATRKLISEGDLELNANLAQDIAQYRQTTGLITNSVGRITRSLQALRKGNIPSAIKLLWANQSPVLRHGARSLNPSATVANNWLELQYGWKPLLQDIHGSLIAMSNYFSSNTTFITQVRGSASDHTRTLSVFSDSFLTPSIPVGTWDISTRTRCKIVLRYRVSDAAKAFLSQTGFTNPINLAWEVLPFSFVADWFLPLGPWLENLSSFQGLTFLSGCETNFTRQSLEGVIAYRGGVPGLDSRYQYRAGGDLSRETIVLDRSKLTSFPGVNPPNPKNPFSDTHMLNALALLRATFRSK